MIFLGGLSAAALFAEKSEKNRVAARATCEIFREVFLIFTVDLQDHCHRDEI
jgi:hypothetical protein